MQGDLKTTSSSKCSDTSLMRLSIHASQGEEQRVWTRNLTSAKQPTKQPTRLLTLNQQPMNERLAPSYDPLSHIYLIQLSYVSLRDFLKPLT